MRRRHHGKGAFSFGTRPMVYYNRSKQDLSYHNKTSANAGDLFPFYIQEIYPGDTFKVKTNVVMRVTSSLLKPVMDNAFLDIYYFFVPNRLTFSRWSEVMGENKKGYWSQPSAVSVPNTFGGAVSDSETLDHRSIAAYFGLPQDVGLNNTNFFHLNVLPFRAFALIYNEWFRDENTQTPTYVNVDESTSLTDKINNSPWSPSNYMGLVPKVNKLHDYFTSCLPSPQKGAPVTIDSASFPASSIPVLSQDVNNYAATPSFDAYPLRFGIGAAVGGISSNSVNGRNQSVREVAFGAAGATQSSGAPLWPYDGETPAPSVPTSPSGLYAMNLRAEIPETAIGSVTVNDLRMAFQTQKMLEKDARGGTRYVEYLQEHFGVVSPDARLQRPEFLGGRRIPMSVFQSTQTTSSTENGGALGEVGAFSLSNGTAGYNKGFVEHGFVIGVACVRQFHTYQQGIDRFWMRHDRLDYYDPVFSNIGEQPVYKTELYGMVDRDVVFGYNEAWADLRFRPSKVTGQLNSFAPTPLDIWHFGDKYDNAPALNSEFIRETDVYINRALSVKSDISDQFIFDFYNKQSAIRVIPTYGTPGLIDHH
ncbi:major capsid protein [Dipodfec virus UOA04_Rod_986]|nr:major capsid protein [Dipodfec virus UOA04_Rod_986]